MYKTETVCILKIYFIGFFHYNLVTSDNIGLEFQQQFEMPTTVLQQCIHVKCKYMVSPKAKTYRNICRRKTPASETFTLKIMLTLNSLCGLQIDDVIFDPLILKNI